MREMATVRKPEAHKSVIGLNEGSESSKANIANSSIITAVKTEGEHTLQSEYSIPCQRLKDLQILE